MVVQMGRRERRRFTDEFKAEVVGLVRSSDKSVAEVSRDLDLSESAVRTWVQRAETQDSRQGCLGAAERDELGRLRRQVRVLEEERAILKKAAAFFAKEIR
jgi:transposase-like protein